MKGIDVEKLLQDFANKDVLADGAIKGIDMARSLRAIKAKLGVLKGEYVQSANATEKTDFSELAASFNSKNSVAHNDDPSMKSPLPHLAGAGDIDIGAMFSAVVTQKVQVKTEETKTKATDKLKGKLKDYFK